MASDYEDLYDIDNMSDADLKDLVLQELQEHPEIDVDLIEVSVQDGEVRIAGRVGTEQEVQQVEHVLTDLLGASDIHNELVIDELVRGQRSEAADDAFIEEREAESQTGETARRTSDTAEHLMDDIEADQFGTHNVQDAIQRGTAYEPPDRDLQEGIRGGEDH
jgi:hypothetical protein